MNDNQSDNINNNTQNKVDLEQQQLLSPVEASASSFPFSTMNSNTPISHTSQTGSDAGAVPVVPSTSLPPRKRARTQEEKEQRRIERILRNRRAAHLSREKKKKYIEFLENSLIALIHGTRQYKSLLDKLLEQDYKNPILVSFVNENPGFINERFQDLTFSEILEKINQNKNLNVPNGKNSSNSLNDDAYGSPASTPTMSSTMHDSSMADNSPSAPSSARRPTIDSRVTSPIMQEPHMDSFDSAKAKTVSPPPSSFLQQVNGSIPPKKLKISNPSIATIPITTSTKSTKGRKKKLGSPVPDFNFVSKNSPRSPSSTTARKNKKNLIVTTPTNTTAPPLSFDSFTSNPTFSASSATSGSVTGINANPSNNVTSSIREGPLSPSNSAFSQGQHQAHHSPFNSTQNISLSSKFPSHFSPPSSQIPSDELLSGTQQGTIMSSYLRSHHYNHSSNPSTPKSATLATFGNHNTFKHNGISQSQSRISKTPPFSSISPRIIPSRITLSPDRSQTSHNHLGILLNNGNKSYPSSSNGNNITLPPLHQQPPQVLGGSYSSSKMMTTASVSASDSAAAAGASIHTSTSGSNATAISTSNRRRPSEVAAVAQLLNMNPQLDLGDSQLKNGELNTTINIKEEEQKQSHVVSFKKNDNTSKKDSDGKFNNGEEGEEDAVMIMMSFKQGK